MRKDLEVCGESRPEVRRSRVTLMFVVKVAAREE